MSNFKAIHYFQWGNLKLKKGEALLIEELDRDRSLVTVKHHPDKTLIVSTKAVENMVFLKKIERLQ
ncbi:MAG: hypothetical protein COY80_01240 [Candidatus Pacebacteria bacterium CG_4_10_14_0_8_um_filter_42_14]|nr:MAG: hypothetical protein COY80_01240 [Candidatus Pacebacteria bacterium CG_4_10_14_0_8_um_filter_42_14]